MASVPAGTAVSLRSWLEPAGGTVTGQIGRHTLPFPGSTSTLKLALWTNCSLLVTPRWFCVALPCCGTSGLANLLHNGRTRQQQVILLSPGTFVTPVVTPLEVAIFFSVYLQLNLIEHSRTCPYIYADSWAVHSLKWDMWAAWFWMILKIIYTIPIPYGWIPYYLNSCHPVAAIQHTGALK